MWCPVEEKESLGRSLTVPMDVSLFFSRAESRSEVTPPWLEKTSPLCAIMWNFFSSFSLLALFAFSQANSQKPPPHRDEARG